MMPFPAGGSTLNTPLMDFILSETARFLDARPKTKALAERSGHVWRGGAPMHWMTDWATPIPIYAARAEGAKLWDVDGFEYDDFCLGDTPSMFGHARPEIARAIAKQAQNGMGFMLPTETAVEVGELLTERFGLTKWQMATTASDANRAAIRWARAITRRPKILIFDGCYHGMVDDAFVVLNDGTPVMKKGLIGQVADFTDTTTVIPFNDLDALEDALKYCDIACVLCEPVMTNCGMIAPIDGFHEALRTLTRKYGTLLAIDETHTLSSGYGGYTRSHGLEPDMFVVGKAIAGGVPAAVWGVTEEIAARMDQAQAAIGSGSSGIGTTLSGNALAMSAMKVMLTEVMTEATFADMTKGAENLVTQLRAVIAEQGLNWSVVHVGARVELVFGNLAPKNASQMRKLIDPLWLKALHLFLINEGVLIAPFHNMMLVSPFTSPDACTRLGAAISAFGERVTRYGLT
ncbi:aspartate aminotransferase family protein [Asticcacaulis machinosus]|uniref:Aspartate aminotransferase family protein n=1 Tax=Asticcacaulis machinosus TaxID=2984211 RepID=A0ABT5HIQ2_9CAUL|nr:aspartate aminotransferase family protein [Asticcacaulis machinosus]MDC7676108.1 aspartate aminotransferase family protein [Asticcacaulis machinosus]